MATLIYNENTYVRWDKDECHTYSITNLLDYSDVTVVITDLTSTWSTTFILAANGVSNGIELPADGVYKICAVADVSGVQDEVIVPVTSFAQSVINIGQMNAQDESRVLQVDLTGIGTIYQSTAYGGSDPDNNWTSPPASYLPLLTVLNDWLDANGNGDAIIIPPGTTDPNYPWIAQDPEDYQLVFLSIDGYEISQVITEQDTVNTPVFHQPDIDCIASWVPALEDQELGQQWVSSIVLDGGNILENPIFVGNADGVQEFFDAIQIYLNANGGGGIIDTNDGNLWWLFENCSTPGPITLANVFPSEEECDYIYEFCDTYACISRLVQQWLCNPCPDKCDPNYVEAMDARQRAIELSTLFFHALMPLVSKDRMWHLGNWDVSDQRTCNVNEIVNLYKEIRDFLNQCGFDCCDPCKDCGCSDCDPVNGKYSSNGCSGCNK